MTAKLEMHHGDALAGLVGLADNMADAVIMDPPYCSGGVTEASRGRAPAQGIRGEAGLATRFSWFDSDNMTTPGLVFLLRSISFEASRVVHEGGHFLTFCDWRMVPILAPALESAGWRLRNLIVWDKGHFGAGTGFRPTHELIIHLTKRSPKFHAADVGNVLRVSRVPSKTRLHPTEKPIELMERLARVVAPQGGMILDPFAGSGSTLKAAANLSINAIGFERDPAYLAAARERLGLTVEEAAA